MTSRIFVAVALFALVCLTSGRAGAVGSPQRPTPAQPTATQPEHSPAAALDYIDRRAAAWLRAPAYAGQRFPCAITCHTTLWYAPARAALGGEPNGGPIQLRLRNRLQARIDLPGAWADQIGFFGKPGSDTRDQSLGSEAVLNALALALMDDPAQQRPLTERALGRMWESQRADGAWSWMQFDQEPWEAGNVDWGASLAALAVGRTSAGYQLSHRAAIGRLRGYLQSRLADAATPMTLHDRLFTLWASVRLPGLLTAAQQDSIARAAAARQQASGAWSLRGLLREPADRAEDGYATGLSALALCRSGRQRSAANKAMVWLRRSQRADGAWPSRAISADHSSMADLHLRDGAASFAVMALQACQPAGAQ